MPLLTLLPPQKLLFGNFQDSVSVTLPGPDMSFEPIKVHFERQTNILWDTPDRVKSRNKDYSYLQTLGEQVTP